MMNDVQALEKLLNARHPCVEIVTTEEAEALHVVRDAMMGRSEPFFIWSVLHGLYDGRFGNPDTVPESENAAPALFHLATHREPVVAAMLDLQAHLEDPRAYRALRETIDRMRQTRGHLILIDHEDKLPPAIRAHTTRLDLSYPDEDELEQIVRRTLKELNREVGIHVEIQRSTYQMIIKNLRGLTRREAEMVIVDAVMDDKRFDENDLNHILARKRQLLSSTGMLEYVESPATLDEIGGLERLKGWLAKREKAFDQKASEYGLQPPRGVLMLGVQGAGKSLCAKAISAAWQRPLLRMDTGGLYDRWVGSSERRLAESLRQAEMMAPIVLWIDEIEKAFASAASQSTDGGLSQRMFGTLLTWMQEHTEPVFLVATANNIDALPPELLRKGRFDEIFFVDLPAEEARRQIFRIHLSKRGQDPDKNAGTLDLDALVAASEGFSGAEIEQAIISAMYLAFHKKRDLDTKMIVETMRQSPPLSVTMRERIDQLRRWAKDRCMPAD